jgi:hypothetical protein
MSLIIFVVFYYLIIGALIIGGIVIVLSLFLSLINKVSEKDEQEAYRIQKAIREENAGSNQVVPAKPAQSSMATAEPEQGKHYRYIKASTEREAVPGRKYRICSVKFPYGKKIYDYLCDDIDVNEGDKVVVYAQGQDKEVTVVSTRMVTADELELPFEKYSHIIAKIEFNADPDIEEDARERFKGDIEIDDIDENNDMIESGEIDDVTLEDLPFICPECGEPYDGIECENCGFMNDEPGMEEVSSDDRLIEGIIAAAMYDEYSDDYGDHDGGYSDYDDDSALGDDYGDFDDPDDFDEDF